MSIEEIRKKWSSKISQSPDEDRDIEDVEFLLEQIERYEKAVERVDKAIYTQHCTMNHMENTEHEKGQISGLIKSSNILNNTLQAYKLLEKKENNFG